MRRILAGLGVLVLVGSACTQVVSLPAPHIRPIPTTTSPPTAEMERSSEALDESVCRVLDAEDTLLKAYVREVMSTGTATITETSESFQMT